MKKATETKRKCPSFAKRALPSFPRIVAFPNSRDMYPLRNYFLACSAGGFWRGEWIFSSVDQASILNKKKNTVELGRGKKVTKPVGGRKKNWVRGRGRNQIIMFHTTVKQCRRNSAVMD